MRPKLFLSSAKTSRGFGFCFKRITFNRATERQTRRSSCDYMKLSVLFNELIKESARPFFSVDTPTCDCTGCVSRTELLRASPECLELFIRVLNVPGWIGQAQCLAAPTWSKHLGGKRSQPQGQWGAATISVLLQTPPTISRGRQLHLNICSLSENLWSEVKDVLLLTRSLTENTSRSKKHRW